MCPDVPTVPSVPILLKMEFWFWGFPIVPRVPVSPRSTHVRGIRRRAPRVPRPYPYYGGYGRYGDGARSAGCRGLVSFHRSPSRCRVFAALGHCLHLDLLFSKHGFPRCRCCTEHPFRSPSGGGELPLNIAPGPRKAPRDISAILRLIASAFLGHSLITVRPLSRGSL